MPHGDMVQIHMLTSYPAALLNRDDAGLAKRVPFGGAVRTRVSSQCLKKHWREAPGISELGDLADRSTRIYEVRVARPLQTEHGASEEEATAIAQYLMDFVDTKPVDKKPTESSQLLVLTRAETEFLYSRAVEILERGRAEEVDLTDVKAIKALGIIDKTDKQTLKALPASIDTAMFGRMVTSSHFDRVDAAIHVAHAMTTHAEAAETDYFTAVDTLKTRDDDAGAGLIQDTELTSGVFYIYAVVDMNQLRSNLLEKSASAERLTRNLVEVMATHTPGAKRGSTAPYAYAEFVLVERGDEQPRTLANAFRKPVVSGDGDIMALSSERLVEERAGLASMYGMEPKAWLATKHEVNVGSAQRLTFPELLHQVFDGEG